MPRKATRMTPKGRRIDGLKRINICLEPATLEDLDWLSQMRYDGMLNRSLLLRTLVKEEAERQVAKGSFRVARGRRNNSKRYIKKREGGR